MNDLEIGILEFGYSTNDSLTTVENVIDYCIKADMLGFRSFWLTEHHNFAGNSPWSSPDIILPILLGHTEKIRVGVAGVLINYHSPYRVALDYKLLNNLFNERVDLGFANGTPSLEVSRMLSQRNYNRRPQNFLKKIKQVKQLLLNEQYYFERELIVPPYGGNVPEMYLLGSFCHNLGFALRNQLNFCKSCFHDTNSLNEDPKDLIKYHETFKTKWGREPSTSLAISIVCAKSKSRALSIVNNPKHINVVNTIIGGPDDIYSRVMFLAEKYKVSQIVISDRSNHHETKIEALNLISKRFNLK